MDRRIYTNEEVIEELDGMNSEFDMTDDDDEDIPVESNPLYDVSNLMSDEESEDDDYIISTKEMDIGSQTFVTDLSPTQQFIAFPKHTINWMDKPMTQKKILLQTPDEVKFPTHIQSPIDYFMRYFNEEAFTEMAMFTNIYAEQINTNNWIPTTAAEIKVFLGLNLTMGVMSGPGTSFFWGPSKFPVFANHMTMNRFLELRKHFHVINNKDIPPTNVDKFIKVRPLYNHLKQRLYQLPIENNLNIGRQTISFRDRFTAEFERKGRTLPTWGIQTIQMCGSKGMIYDFMMIPGTNTELDSSAEACFGKGGAVVMKFVERLKKYKHFVFFNDYFTSYNLLSALNDRKIYASGTVRLTRLSITPLLKNKHLARLGCGASYEVSGTVEGQKCEIGLIKWWIDGTAVVFASNFTTSGEPDKVKRWNDELFRTVLVERPEVVSLCETRGSGVEVFNEHVNLYKNYVKSRKWTFRVIAHFFDMAVVNSWLEYKNDALHHELPEKNTMKLPTFKQKLAMALVNAGKEVD